VRASACVCVHREARFYDGSSTAAALPFLSIQKMVTQRKFNNLYFHIRGFPLSVLQQQQKIGRQGEMGLELFYNAYLCEALYFI